MCGRLKSNRAFWNVNGKEEPKNAARRHLPKKCAIPVTVTTQPSLQLQTACCGNFNNIIYFYVFHGCQIAVLPTFIRFSEYGSKQLLINIFGVQCYLPKSIHFHPKIVVSVDVHSESIKSVCTGFAKVWCLKQIVCSELANHGGSPCISFVNYNIQWYTTSYDQYPRIFRW